MQLLNVTMFGFILNMRSGDLGSTILKFFISLLLVHRPLLFLLFNPSYKVQYTITVYVHNYNAHIRLCEGGVQINLRKVMQEIDMYISYAYKSCVTLRKC